MRSELIDEAAELVPEPPVLINLVSRRIKQLNNGRPALVKTDHRMGSADIALTEIISERITAEEAEEES